MSESYDDLNLLIGEELEVYFYLLLYADDTVILFQKQHRICKKALGAMQI